MTCKEANDLLHGYLDGELDLVHSLAIEQHLKDCPACASSIREQQTLRAALTGGSLYFSAPDGLEQRVRAAISLEARTEIRAEQRASPRKWTWWSILVPAVATGAVVLVAVLWFARPSPEARLADEFVSAHVRSLMGETGHLTDVASSDQHTVKPWFTGKLSFAPPVTDLNAEGFPLVGGRLDYVGEHTVAALVYQRRKHYINLFISPSDRRAGAGEELRTMRGYNLLHWVRAGMEYWAVSDVSAGDLREFAQRLQ